MAVVMPQFGRVLVPLDFSELSDTVLRYGVELTDPEGTTILVHVLEPLPLHFESAFGTFVNTEGLRRIRENAQKLLEESRSRYPEKNLVTELREEFQSGGAQKGLSYLDYALLTCIAHAQDWDSWEQQHERARQWRPATARVDKDLAMLAQRAGDFALQACAPAQARQAYELAREHWVALRKPERVQEVEARLKDAGE